MIASSNVIKKTHRRQYHPSVKKCVLWTLYLTIAATIYQIYLNQSLTLTLSEERKASSRDQSPENIGGVAVEKSDPNKRNNSNTVRLKLEVNTNRLNLEAKKALLQNLKKDSRPWLILHVGPPKTATKTIQYGLKSNAQNLATDDNFYFIGHYVHGISLEGGKERRKKKFTNEKGKVRTFKLGRFHKNWPYVKTQLMEHLSYKHNVVIASEHHSYKPFLWDNMYEYNFLQATVPVLMPAVTKKTENITSVPASIAIAAINDKFNEDNNHEPLFSFRVKVVVTYRHFFEWLPSLYHQTCENIAGGHIYRPGLIDFVERYLNRLVQYDPSDPSTSIYTAAGFGENDTGFIQPMMCKLVDSETSHGSVWAYLKWSSKPELCERIDIFDMHQQQLPEADPTTNNNETKDEELLVSKHDVLADFVCQILPTASTTCSRLMEEHRQNIADKKAPLHTHSSSTDENKFMSLPDKNRINDRARAMPEFALNTTTNTSNGIPKREFHKRIESWFEKMDQQQQQQQQHPNDDYDRRFKRCLDSDLTERLKTASRNSLLQMILLSKSHGWSRNRNPESEAYYRGLFRSSIPTHHLLLSQQQHQQKGDSNHDNGVGDSWLLSATKAHDKSFDAFVAKGKLCEADIDKLFANEDFMKFVFFQ